MRILLIVALILMTSKLTGQNLDSHKWENRLILIISTNQDSEVYNNQIEEFETSYKGFAERRLIIYHVLPNQYKTVDYENDKSDNKWRSSSKLFKRYADDQSDFKVVLIGLDGSVKLQQNDLLTTDKLFETIDAMPMRRSEIKNKKN
ncbi:DUF4174 domain-containing protein [Winogradskyella forsetii]|uniref:DUF4174 domain-containing protein n=1 Tax=Winogradskyella forsetii TaxID=2686077 RepID=UPI0015B9370F|nr:DUF4174 domain-containing protein [Winogradskyella forsetii]